MIDLNCLVDRRGATISASETVSLKNFKAKPFRNTGAFRPRLLLKPLNYRWIAPEKPIDQIRPVERGNEIRNGLFIFGTAPLVTKHIHYPDRASV